jgi:hypothetical protein
MLTFVNCSRQITPELALITSFSCCREILQAGVLLTSQFVFCHGGFIMVDNVLIY